MALDVAAVIADIAAAEPVVAAVLPTIISWLTANHPTLDLTPLRSGLADFDAARAAALKESP